MPTYEPISELLGSIELIILKDFVDGNYWVEIYIHLLALAGTAAKNTTIVPLAGIEPVALRFRCSALTNWSNKNGQHKNFHNHKIVQFRKRAFVF
jgi:hypothetical protein